MKAGWEISRLGDICQIKPPKKEAKAHLSEADLVSFVPMRDLNIGKQALTLGDTRPLEKVYGSYTYFSDNDVLLAKITPCFENGKLGIAKDLSNGIGFGSSEFIVFRSLGRVIPEYLYHYLSQDGFRESGAKIMTGAVGHKRVPKEYIDEYEIPLPPLPEQKRIVAILDEAFAGIAAAVANTEKNLANAREVFESALQSVFGNDSKAWSGLSPKPNIFDTALSDAENAKSKVKKSRTGGRAASTRHILGDYSLSVGRPSFDVRAGWVWSSLTELAQMESGHTPSRRHPEYWGGDVPWIGIKDARNNHGSTVTKTLENTNQTGLDNSSSRLLPKGTVCLSRTASVGYVTIMGEQMATSQDFVNWVCGEHLVPEYLQFLLVAQGKEIFKFSSGSVHQTIYYPEAKAFHICHPITSLQEEICKYLGEIKAASKELVTIYQQKLSALAELKQSLLQKAFAGELTSEEATPAAVALQTTSPEFGANVIALNFRQHEKAHRGRTYGRVKAQKALHLVESIGGIDLGRSPDKDAAGPNDTSHARAAEDWAKANQFFEFVMRSNGKGYDFKKLMRFGELIVKATVELKPMRDAIERSVAPLVEKNTEEAEIFTTVHAAWNNLIIDGDEITDDAIVTEAREDWHVDKMKYSRNQFLEAIADIRQRSLEPDGSGGRVGIKQGRLL